VLANEPGRMIAVLGEMRELGDHSDGFHAALAEPILAAGVGYAILVGEAMAALANALEGKMDFVHVPDAATARERLNAVLAPGDAVFIPGMWWHHVRSLEPFNVLVNYWWRSAPAFLPTPVSALYHALWAVRDLPERDKQAWANVFDYYVFGPKTRAGAHVPEQARDVLGPIDDTRARRIRAMLIGWLNR